VHGNASASAYQIFLDQSIQPAAKKIPASKPPETPDYDQGVCKDKQNFPSLFHTKANASPRAHLGLQRVNVRLALQKTDLLYHGY
jgi:hypothetical protein